MNSVEWSLDGVSVLTGVSIDASLVSGNGTIGSAWCVFSSSGGFVVLLG